MDASLKERLKSSPALPSLPTVAVEVLRLCQREDSGIDAIAQVLTRDPALAAKVLRLVNSPFFGLSQPVTTLSRALMVLGMNSVRTLALSFSLVDMRRDDPKGFDLSDYWKRSLIAATASREVARAIGFSGREEAFLAGLLQDIGILALARLEPECYSRMRKDNVREHEAVARIEKETFGSDHVEVGGWLLENWNVPAPLRMAVSHSHDGVLENGDPVIAQLVSIVAVGGRLAEIWMVDDPGTALDVARAEARRLLGVDETIVDGWLDGVAGLMMEMASLFDVKVGSQSEVQRILDEAKESLMLLSMRASQQAQTLEQAATDLKQQALSLQEEARRDALTGLINRREFDRYLNARLQDCVDERESLCLIMIDVDHFKKVNDGFGHQVGDAVLKAVATCMQERLRRRDRAARYGGEEFALILPETDEAGGHVVAERVREMVEALEHDNGAGGTLKVTVSLGFAAVDPGAALAAEVLVRRADEALYMAKRIGRNLTLCASQLASNKQASGDR